jgi:hypothetical protein
MNDANVMRDWASSMWNSGQAEMQRINSRTEQFLNMTMPAASDLFGWAATQRDRFNQYVMPQMESLFSEAQMYASKGEEDRQRGMAIQDVKAATEAQRASQLRKLDSYGVDPTETRHLALDKQAGVAEAAMSALAANQAGERTKQIGRDLRAQAIDVGTGFLQDANASSVNAANIGGAGLSAADRAAQTGIAVQQGALPYMQGANANTSTAAGIVDTSYGRELDYAIDQRAAEAADAQAMSGIGGAIGSGMNAFVPNAGAFQNFMNVGGAALGGAPRPPSTGGADGGPVSAPGGPTSDAGAIRISDGEYIIPADVVRKLGTNHFDKLIEKEAGRPPPSTKTAIPVGA